MGDDSNGSGLPQMSDVDVMALLLSEVLNFLLINKSKFFCFFVNMEQIKYIFVLQKFFKLNNSKKNQ